MAASSLNVVRVRLHFDYPPPAVSTCRMCWLLIDLNRCRVVADLVSVIREKFDYSRKTCLDLFIEDCYLPPSESIYVVRDNDSIRVKAESLSQQNGTELETSKSSKVKKRRRETEEQEVQGEQSNISALKKRKSTEEGQAVQLGVTENVKKKKKSKKRKRKEEQAGERQTETANKTPAAPVTKPQSEKSSKRLQHSTSSFNGKPVARKPQETSSDSSDSSDEEPSKRTTQHPKPQRKVSSGAGAVSKLGSAAKHKDNSSSSSESDTVQPPAKKLTPAKSLPAKPKPSPANAAVNTKPKEPPSKKHAQSSSSDSDSDSSSSTERPPPKRTPVRIPPPVPTSNTKATATASASVSKKPAAKTAETSSDSDSSSSLERPIKKPSAPSTPKDPSSAPSSAPSGTPAAKLAVELSAKPASTASESDSSEEIELVIRKPVLNGMGLSVAEVVSSSPIVGAGRGRGDARSPGKGIGRGEGRFARRGSGSRDRGRGNGRGNGTPWNKGFRYEYSDEEQKRSRRFNDSLTNTSLILQNPPEPAPKRDYGVFPLLAAPPAVGQKIAFKLLELTENYSPEVSDYKEGKITGFNVTTNMVELQLLSRPKVPLEPGKFDLVYENPDGSEVVEYAVTQGSQLSAEFNPSPAIIQMWLQDDPLSNCYELKALTERWDSLLEPRLIVENVG